MKTTHLFATIALLFILNSAENISAQTTMQHCCKDPNFCKRTECPIPNLTEEQQSKLKEFRIAHLKEMQTYQNQLGELKAKEHTLATADKPDIKAINANIDEITKVQNQMMKSKASHRQQVRALLTEEQKLWFDTHKSKNGRHKMKNQMEHRMHKKGDSSQK